MPKKINIVHLVPSIGSGGGAENVLYHLFRTIDCSRFQMTLLYWGEQDDLAGLLREAGAAVIKLPLKKVISLDSVVQVVQAVNKADGQLLHTHFMDADLLGFLATRWTGIPLVTQVHSFPFPACWRHAWRYKFMSMGMSRIICVSQIVRQYLCCQSSIGSKKCTVVHNGIDLKKFDENMVLADRAIVRRSFGMREGDIVIGNVSRLIPDKGHEFLVKAMPAVLKDYPQAKLLIVGDGPLRGELERLAQYSGVSSNVFFAGKRADIPQLLSIMDICVFPTFREAFGICVLEAMAAGKPVIATDDAAIPEIITHGKSGLLIHPGSAPLIEDALKKILSDDQLKQKLSVNARERVQHFSLDLMTRAYEQLYREIAQ